MLYEAKDKVKCWSRLTRSAVAAVIGLAVHLYSESESIRPANGSWLEVHSPLHHKKRRLAATRFDPKTVVQKLVDPRNEGNRLDSLRFVAFGTSRTWGTEIPNPQKQAYIKLVSPAAVNLGMRATPADYPSVCFYSMIKDQVFDVVILEFFPWKRNQDDFVRLTRRVRARFPSAVIIYLNPHLILDSVRIKGKTAQWYLKRAGLKAPYGAAFEQLVGSLPDSDFKFIPPGTEGFEVNALPVYEEAIKAVGGQILEFPTFRNNPKQFLLEGSKYFGNEKNPFDSIHLSVLGHKEAAKYIRRLLSEIDLTALVNGTDTGSWAAGKDRCLSWFTNGNFNFQQVPFRNMTLAPLSAGQQKFSLEVSMEGGEISVNCPFRPCQIFFNHMVYGPELKYPRVHFEVNGKKIFVNPTNHYGYHMNQLTYAGTVEDGNGTITIRVTPLKEDRNRPDRFRITGIATTHLLPAAPGKPKQQFLYKGSASRALP